METCCGYTRPIGKSKCWRFKNKNAWLRLLPIWLAALLVFPAISAQVQQIGWEDLVEKISFEEGKRIAYEGKDVVLAFKEILARR